MKLPDPLRVALTAVTLCAAIGSAHAQGAPAGDPGLTTVSAKPPARKSGGRRLALIVRQMTQDSGAKIECDSTVASESILPPQEPTTGANFEAQIDALVSRLPKGTTWAKLYMPDLPGKAYKADNLADYAIAEARLFGTVGGALPKGTIEVLGQALSAEKAASVGEMLKLKPIYIITNTLARRQTPEQRAQALLAMNPDQRAAAIGDMMKESAQVMQALFSGMSPEERQQFMSGAATHLTLDNGGQATIIMRAKSDSPAPPEAP